MVETHVFKNYFATDLGPEDMAHILVGPHPAFGAGAVSVTAQGVSVDSAFADPAVHLEVVQIATRRSRTSAGDEQRFLDVVVRNNARITEPPRGIVTNFNLYTCITTP